MYYSLLGILKLYAVYTPYITEYIYQDFYRKQEKELSLHQTLWAAEQEDMLYLAFGEHLKETISHVRKAKTEKQMSMKDPIPELIITWNCRKITDATCLGESPEIQRKRL